VEKLEIPSLQEVFRIKKTLVSLLYSTGIKLLPVEFLLPPHQSSTPPPSVNDELLPTNISESAQQSSSTYKICTTSLVHTCACVFWFS